MLDNKGLEALLAVVWQVRHSLSCYQPGITRSVWKLETDMGWMRPS